MAYDNELRGTLGRNTRKDAENHPDYKGKIQILGRKYWLSGWIKDGPTGKFLSLAATDAEKQYKAGTPAPPQYTAEEIEDDIPF